MNEHIRRLNELGQSLWYDNIQRDLLVSGALGAMVEDGSVQGLTSNPSIFEKAIASSSDYDEELRRLSAEGADRDRIYLELVAEDIVAAADLLAPLYRKTNGVDGYVSVEVSPNLASDTEGTIREALELSRRLDRPNLMIKVPGTKAGVPAVRELTRQGVSVNVTLLFSLSQYDAIARAYLEGLETRLERGEPVDRVCSVASFFVSRVDTLVDERLAKEHPELEPDSMGKAAIANARLVYAEFQEIFSGSGWERLRREGAKLQRVLWASTSTKDPRYADTRYVDNLIGPNTVNTVPPATLEAFKDHGKPHGSLLSGLEDARAHRETLRSLGIDLEEVGETLQAAGVSAFAKSFEGLLDVIETRRAAWGGRG